MPGDLWPLVIKNKDHFGYRAKNVGWRLDYFLVSTRILDKVKESKIREKVFGSDHCPIVMAFDKLE